MLGIRKTRSKNRFSDSIRTIVRELPAMIYDERPASTWEEIREYVLKRDGNRCRDCGSKKDLNVHHIKPVSEGGLDKPTNLITLCRRCHMGKHEKIENWDADPQIMLFIFLIVYVLSLILPRRFRLLSLSRFAFNSLYEERTNDGKF